MKNFNLKTINAHKILFAASLLTSGAFVTATASAAPRGEVREARRDLRDARQDLRHERLQENRRVPRVPVINLNRTIRGVVTKNLDGNDFNIRLNNGQIVRVLVPSGEPKRISKGDVVEAYGRSDNGTFRALSASILHNA